MVSILQLWLPLLISSVVVFLASWAVHMLPVWHKSDYPKMPNEDRVRDAIRPLSLAPGEYIVPRAASSKEMCAPEFVEKLKQGPVLMLTVWPNQPFSMGKSLVWWFIYCLIVGIFCAYVAGRALMPGAAFGDILRFVGVTAFLSYVLALWQSVIWYKRSGSVTAKMTLDGLIYAVLTGVTFGLLWPK